MNPAYLLWVFAAVYVLQSVSALWITELNVRHLKRFGKEVPAPFQGLIDAAKLARIGAYTVDNSRLYLVRKVVLDVVLLALILSGPLPWLDGFVSSRQLHYLWAGAIFFVALGIGFFVVQLPFDYYYTFVIEEKYGFNRSNVRTWALDTLKECGLGMVAIVVVIVPVLWTIKSFPNYWWFWGFVAVSLAQTGLTVAYPVVIAPLFNKFEPLEDRVLAEKMESLVEKAGMRSGGIFQMDAGRRSTHSNAYFTGLGRTKRIVVFDTLIQSHNHDEVLAVLAHELGHFKDRHVLKSLILSLAATLAAFYLTYLLMGWDSLYWSFGFDPSRPCPALFVTAVFWQRAGFFLSPVLMSLSRRFERKADLFAIRLLQTAKPMALALKKLAGHNLSNLNPHPFYVWFNYSHPPLAERVSLLEGAEPTADYTAAH